MRNGAEFDIPVTEDQVLSFPIELTEKLLRIGMTFRSEEIDRAVHDSAYYASSSRKRDAIVKMIKEFRGEDCTGDSASNVQEVVPASPRGVVRSDNYDWKHLLYKDWSTIRAAQTIKMHGLPREMEDRIRLLSLLRKYDPADQIPVYYEDLIAYSANFLNAYGPKVLMDIESRGDITGCDFTNEVLSAYNNGKITAEEAELMFYVYPANHRLVPDPARYAITFTKEKGFADELITSMLNEKECVEKSMEGDLTDECR